MVLVMTGNTYFCLFNTWISFVAVKILLLEQEQGEFSQRGLTSLTRQRAFVSSPSWESLSSITPIPYSRTWDVSMTKSSCLFRS